MITAWIIFLGAILLPFFVAFYAALRGGSRTYPPINNTVNSDNENKQTALLKEQVDLLDKNRRESWTSPTYFKK